MPAADTRSTPSPTAAAFGDRPRDLAAAALAMARRFDDGATLWCVSPSWPHHARHVAVEFVHPVIVGKRALPALVVPGEDPVRELRVAADPGDLVVVVGTAEDRRIVELLRRAPAWGLTTVWIGAGGRPAVGAADHVIWLDDAEAAPLDGSFILLYHLLWELTHVCFEHRGALAPPPVDDEEVCITCSDEGRLAEVVAAVEDEAVVRTADGEETIDVSLVAPVAPYELVLVHAGMAIGRVDTGAPR